jgi:pimeloyl-ACP methyl ester carboxylesterase
VPELEAPDGTLLHYEVFGEDGARPVPVVLLHGFAADLHTNWVRPGVVGALTAAGWRVVAADARGHGRSGKPHDDASYAGTVMVDDVSALLDHLGADAAHVAGYSMGAYTALRVAIGDPRARSLVLGGVGGRVLQRGVVDRRAIADGLVAEDRRTITDPTARAFRFFAEATKADRFALAAVQRALAPPLPDLSTVPVPTLVVAGEADTMAGAVGDLAAAIPGAKAVTVPGDHINVPTKPEFAAAIADFLAGVPA